MNLHPFSLGSSSVPSIGIVMNWGETKRAVDQISEQLKRMGTARSEEKLRILVDRLRELEQRTRGELLDFAEKL